MTDRYPRALRALHWLMMLLVLAALGVGIAMSRVEPGGLMNRLFDLHRSLGLLALALLLLRLWLRWKGPLPPPAPGMSALQHRVVHAVHLGFYAVLLALPILGWVGSSAYGAPVIFFQLFTLPSLIAPDRALAEAIYTVHIGLGYALVALIVAHLLGVIYHQAFLKDGLLRRMWPL